MAVYAADIRVGVVGLPALTKLGKALDQVTRKTKLLNAELQKVKRAIKAPTISVNTSRALSDIQKVNRELDKLNSRKVAPTVGSSRGGGGGRGFGGGTGALGKGLLTGAGFGLAGTAGGLASVAAQALNPITLLGAGLGVAAVAAFDYGKAAAIAASETQRFETALRALTEGDDYVEALEAIKESSDRFFTTIPETTKQFTKLTAATTANGLSVEDTKNVYEGLAAANIALGGDAERLNGILLATQQVFSKGKVQAEELRGQIGERLPGAFALFAKSMDVSTAKLDKMLEMGQVSVEDFVTFSKALLEEFGDSADEQLGKSELAGQRLAKAFSDLQLKIGRVLQPLGAAIQDWATGVVESLDKIVTKLMEILNIGDEAIAKNIKILEAERNQLIQQAGGPFGAGLTGPEEARLRILESQLKTLKEQKAISDSLRQGTGTKTKPNQSEDLGGEGKGEESQTAKQLEREQLKALRLLEQQKDFLRTAEEKLKIAEFDLRISQAGNKFLAREIQLEKELFRIRASADKLAQDPRATPEALLAIFKQLKFAEQLIRNDFDKDIKDIMTNAGRALGEGLAESMEELENMEKMFMDFWKDIANKLPDNAFDTALNDSITSLKGALEDSLVGVLDVAIGKADDLGKVLSDIGRQLLSDVGRLFIRAAISQIPFPTFGPPGRASGGVVMPNTPYIVGENGPELVIPSSSGTVINNSAFDEARSSMASSSQTEAANSIVTTGGSEGSSSSLSSSEITVNYETSVINSVSYVTEEQFQEGMKKSANQGKSIAFKELRNRPASRVKAGV